MYLSSLSPHQQHLRNPLSTNQRTSRPFPLLFPRPISFRLFRSANVLLRSCFCSFSRWRPLSRPFHSITSSLVTSRSTRPLSSNCAMHSPSSTELLLTRVSTTTKRSLSACSLSWPAPPPSTASNPSFDSCLSMRSETRIPRSRCFAPSSPSPAASRNAWDPSSAVTGPAEMCSQPARHHST